MSWTDGAKEKCFLRSISQPQAQRWLAENGPKELELLFRAIVYDALRKRDRGGIVTDKGRKTHKLK